MVSDDPWPAPAKLNLFLHVLGRRADGYHELQTVFQLLDHTDQISLRQRRDGVVLRTTRHDAIPPDDDLAVRAARLLKAETGARPGVEIGIKKRIPLGGGLGGGSSDAATVLVALNAMWGLALSIRELRAIGARLGADVPVFVGGHAAWGDGRGERLEPIQIGSTRYLVVTPSCHVSTARVFADPALTRSTPRMKIADFLRVGQPPDERTLSCATLLERTGNDCEPVTRKLYPDVAAAIDWLRELGAARMTGTGSSVFVPVTDLDRAGAFLRRVPRGWRGFLARGLDRSPLQDRLARG